MAKEWIFKCFKSSSGTNEIEKWLNTLPKKDKVNIDAMIRRLEITRNWARPLTGKLKGYENLVEIRVKSSNIQYRPIGCYGPKRGEFTILIGAVEKGDKFEPRNALDTAYARSVKIQKEEHTDDYV